MKIPLELNAGRTSFLNFWDAEHGRDVCCQVKGDKLILLDGDGELGREITLAEFVRMVKRNAGYYDKGE